jgi:hypothetical protein
MVVGSLQVPGQIFASPLPLVVRIGLPPTVENSTEKAVNEDDVDAPVWQGVDVLHVAVRRKQKVDAGIVSLTESLKKFLIVEKIFFTCWT